MEDINLIFKRERERQHLTIDEVSKIIKIRPGILEAIESGNFDKLPGIYMKASIKEYAKFLKITLDIEELYATLAPQDALDKIAKESNKRTLEQASIPKNYEELFAEKRIKKQFFNRTGIATYLILVSVILLVLLLLYLAFFKFDSDEAKLSSITPSSSTTETIDIEDNAEESIPQDSIKFSFHANDVVWLRIANDGVNSKQLVLKSGNEYEVTAKEFITVTCDKANAISIRRDGVLLPQLSNHGTVVRNVQITRDEIINPTSVFNPDTNKRKYTKRKRIDSVKNVQTPYRLQPSRPVERKQTTSTVTTTTPTTSNEQ